MPNRKAPFCAVARDLADETGQTTVEWALLLVGFGLPAMVLLGRLMTLLTEYYRMVALLAGLPFS